METTALRELLAARLGLDADSLGPSFLKSVAHWGLQQCGYSDLQTFICEAAAGGEPWRRLVEHVVVSETWFFRDIVPFDHIVEAARRKSLDFKTAPIRVLSCPCSTGEEPYSVAIALREAGLPPGAFRIDAADVNPSAIRAAKIGAFGSRSFRGNGLVDRVRYFEHDQETRRWRLKPALRKMVRFRVANLVSLCGLEDAGPYDIVLCRNLLIYLHGPARASVMTAMRHLLAADGVLIVGHAEAAIAREYGFTGTGDPRAFAFVKVSVSKAQKATPVSARRDRAWGHDLAVGKEQSAPTSPKSLHSMTAAAGQPALTLERIRQLGDQGRNEEAIRACRDYVRCVPDSADGYFLLGVLCSSLGHGHAAETALRRALYLEPDHAAALVHLALTHDAKGDSASAARLRARANRTATRRSQP